MGGYFDSAPPDPARFGGLADSRESSNEYWFMKSSISLGGALSNASRRSWEAVLKAEYESRVTGELGWSAELRKRRLTVADLARRTPAWRRYACESFCDSAAWLYSGLVKHEEFTLPPGARRGRRGWFCEQVSRIV